VRVDEACVLHRGKIVNGGPHISGQTPGWNVDVTVINVFPRLRPLPHVQAVNERKRYLFPAGLVYEVQWSSPMWMYHQVFYSNGT
jgi:hypothetical protein